MKNLGVKPDGRVDTTCFKQRLLAYFPNTIIQYQGRDIPLTFNEDFSNTLAKACELDIDLDDVHLAYAAHIVRCYIFEDSKGFNNRLHAGCQQDSVPPMLIALVSMILECPNIKHRPESTTSAALTISKLLKFNSLKHQRTAPCGMPNPVRHANTQETPFNIYRELIYRLKHIGISVSYGRVLSLSKQIWNSECSLYHQEQVACPPKLRGRVFTTAAVDNINHNSSSTTAKQ